MFVILLTVPVQVGFSDVINIAGFTFPMEERAFKYFKDKCKTIELLKDDVLHRKHFRVKNDVSLSQLYLDSFVKSLCCTFTYLSIIICFSCKCDISDLFLKLF